MALGTVPWGATIGSKCQGRGAMKRREFIKLIGGVAAAWPLVAQAQQQTMPVIGMLNSGPSAPRRDQLEGFHQGLKEAGFVVGQNVTILHLGADDHYDRLPALAAELVHRQVAVIAAMGGQLLHLRQRRPPQRFQSSSPPSPIRSKADSLLVSIVPAATSQVTPASQSSWTLNDSKS
jgi:hypothetical protein